MFTANGSSKVRAVSRTGLIAVSVVLASSAVARAGDHWSFQPPARNGPPAGRDTAWTQNPIAAFVAGRDWERFHTSKNLAMSIAIEAAEIMEKK